jgi:prepilin-type N-terminal cleavage/methylation domain-containing protein
MGAQHGFSLLELIISLALLSTTLIIVSEMLLARERQLARAVRVANRMSAEQAVHQLRRDLRSGVAVGGIAAAWQEGPLVISQADGVIITWSLEGDSLMRGRSDTTGSQGTRQMLDRTMAFRWRWSRVPLLMIMAKVEVSSQPGSPIIGTGIIGTRPPVTMVPSVAVALRGSGAQKW